MRAQLVLSACGDPEADVRQAGFGLVGDLAKAAISLLAPHVAQLAQASLRALEPQVISRKARVRLGGSGVSCPPRTLGARRWAESAAWWWCAWRWCAQDAIRSCNNACWSLGELAVRLAPEHVAPWATAAAERAATLLAAGTRQLPPSLVENAAITLGRVAWRAPEALAPHLGHFCTPWCQVRAALGQRCAWMGDPRWVACGRFTCVRCGRVCVSRGAQALRNVRDDVEKEQAFHGLCQLLRRNAEPVLAPGPAFAALAVAVTSWRNLRSVQLQQELHQVRGGSGRGPARSAWWRVAPGSSVRACPCLLADASRHPGAHGGGGELAAGVVGAGAGHGTAAGGVEWGPCMTIDARLADHPPDKTGQDWTCTARCIRSRSLCSLPLFWLNERFCRAR